MYKLSVQNQDLVYIKPPKPCPPGKTRNPATGRCRKAAVNKAKPPCKDGKVRNSTTGRCRKPRPGNKAKPPCKDGKVRNSVSGRCRKAAVNKAKPPCKDGKVRNSVSGRCRKPRPGNKAASPMKAKTPSPVKAKSVSPIFIMYKTIKEKCKATPLDKCASPCSKIRLPNGKMICTQVKKPKKGPSKQTMRTMAAWA